jgi:hypothetical protein
MRLLKITVKLIKDRNPNWKGYVLFLAYHEFIHLYLNLRFKFKRFFKLHKRP